MQEEHESSQPSAYQAVSERGGQFLLAFFFVFSLSTVLLCACSSSLTSKDTLAHNAKRR